MHLDNFGPVASIEERTYLYGLRSEIINSLPASKNSLKRNPLLLIKLPWIQWSLWRIQNVILHWQELANVNYEQISFFRLLESNWTLFWRTFMTSQSYKRQKQSSALPLAARWWPARWGSKWATATTTNESQFRKCKCGNSVLHHPLLSPCLWPYQNTKNLTLLETKVMEMMFLSLENSTKHYQLRATDCSKMSVSPPSWMWK